MSVVEVEHARRPPVVAGPRLCSASQALPDFDVDATNYRHRCFATQRDSEVIVVRTEKNVFASRDTQMNSYY